jgi:outer membrane protein TolC
MKKVILIISVVIFSLTSTFAQKPVNRLTLDEVIQLAKDQSPKAILSKHTFRSAYWAYRTYKAEYLPSIRMTTSPLSYNRSLTSRLNDKGGYDNIEVNQNSSNLALELSQNVGLTGGRFFLNTSLNRNDDFKNDSISYKSVPYQIGFIQPITGYNELRWNKKIEPIKYEEAKRNYLQSVENISMEASRLFFDLILAQQNLKTAKLNYANSDTLYKIAKGRYNIGTIAENELLQMQLSFLNSGSDVSDAEVDLQLKKARIKSFLGLNDEYDLELIIPNRTPQTNVIYDEVLNLAKTNTPKALEFTRQLIEANRDVAKARSERGFNADLSVNYGINRDAELLKDSYSNYNDLQTISVKLSIPILDWGLGKGKVKMAKSNREVVKATVDQAIVEFEQDIFLKVMQFNRQDDQVALSAKSDTIAQLRYNVTKERFLIGKIDVLDLNVAQTERDAAKQKYINTLSNFWQFYYNMRKLTLYDFDKKTPLEMDFELLLK